MAGWKKKLRYPSESPWFPEYYIGWIVIGNRHHETSSTYVLMIVLYRPEILTSDGIKITNIIKICILGIGSIHGS